MNNLVILFSLVGIIVVQARQYDNPWPSLYVEKNIPKTEKANKCLTTPCKNSGICYGSALSYICSCPPGFDGTQCERDMYCPPGACKNGGSCLREETFDGNPLCTCLAGFYGQQCQLKIKDIQEHMEQRGHYGLSHKKL